MAKKKLGPTTLLFPMPAVLVGTVVEGKANFMTAAWCGIACQTPPAISLAIHKARHTHTGILAEGAFSINVPSVEQARVTDHCGIYSGRKEDKAALFDIFYGDMDTVPLIAECPLNLECRVLHTLDIGSHTLFVGEIIQTHISDSCETDGKPDPVKIDPLVYGPGVQEYFALGKPVAKAFHAGKKG